MKLTKEKAKYFLRDELNAAKEYRKYGLNKLARNELEHAKYFKNLLKKKTNW